MNLVAFKCGFYGIIYRFIFIVRTVAVTKNWIVYFTESVNMTMTDVILSKHLSIASLYVAIKSVFIAGLIWDFHSCWKQYKHVMKHAISESSGICSFCQTAPATISLLCSHKVCQTCYKSQIYKAPYCKTCQTEIVPTLQFAFTDGYSSISSIFCCL
ncbi:hypothetical protein TVAG_250640 [Trichomonas vaginalis G3]|uniref:RING-type domain-containing protein n=1 Tax=Trichomonas vaginalis (strain ATCC PRA-98 / G3) TaxID=412133 RepID=A2ESR3_TRIV3|nr:zinc finger, RING/FYVE/PHD-type domain-containing protein [Trichomonas vaginalis G3]EAY04304.1 hypothetical protein TVAG_250640 [Trichomonas vaginalis G3]KAI5498265.1 zinc finger, RING/FYVE/PHD-type domain-containing protein [Trichomonas vaginalis G3]|eukprot:XP_001316527.1 hypothetical protein [Trichomonas vaginalis G3]